MADGGGVAGPLVANLRLQERYCGEHGSPLYAALLDGMVDDVQDGGPTAELLADWLQPGLDPDAVMGDLPGLRVLGGVHRLVLTGQAPELAAHYPSVGGTAGPDGAWPAFRAVLEAHADDVRPWLASPPQTNEVGRSVPLLGGLRHVAAATGGLPVRLNEFGASAGLNLRADHLPVGPGQLLDSTLPLPDAPDSPVVDRVGADLHPIDPTTDEGRLLLTSYVWPDDLVRLERLQMALDVVRRVPVELRRCSAAELTASLALEPGTVTVLWHSITWQYLSAGEQDDVRASLGRLAADATSGAAFAHVTFEPLPGTVTGHQVIVTVWPGGEERVVGTAAAHGIPTTWV